MCPVFYLLQLGDVSGLVPAEQEREPAQEAYQECCRQQAAKTSDRFGNMASVSEHMALLDFPNCASIVKLPFRP